MGLCGPDRRLDVDHFLIYAMGSIAEVFFITAAAFGGISLYGYTTKTDLSGIGSFLIMGVWGLIIAMVVNMFLQSPMIMWIISVAGVGIFAGLTAYDTQRIKEMYSVGDDGTLAGQEVDHGRVGALSRLHQHVPVPALSHWQSPLNR